MGLRTFPPLRWLFRRLPRFQPLAREIYALIVRRPPPTFFGWLMTTHHQVPWIDEHAWAGFRQDAEDVKRLEATDSQLLEDIDALRWRHWNIAYCVRHAIVHTEQGPFTAVECGVQDGITAFFTLREMVRSLEICGCPVGEIVLYDAWAPMRERHLMQSEAFNVGKYSTISRERAERNLQEFAGMVRMVPGYLPETLDPITAPSTVHYLHIDLNAARPTVAALEFFWPRLVPGSVVLFDDYGWLAYKDTKNAIDVFFSGQPGSLLKLPTGQALYFR